MKKKRSQIAAVLAALSVVLSAGLPAIPRAQAGQSVNAVDYASFDKIDAHAWDYEGGQISVPAGETAVRMVNGAPDKNTAQRLGSTVVLKNLTAQGIGTYTEAEIGLEFEALSGQFSLSLGLSSPTAKPGVSGSMELRFTAEQNTLYLDIIRYAGRAENVLLEHRSFSGMQLGAPFALSLAVETAGRIRLTVAAEESVSAPVEVGGEEGSLGNGYLGMYLGAARDGGRNEVRLQSFSLKALDYRNAENPGKVTADFEDGYFNTEAWYSATSPSYYHPAYLKVEDGVLVMRNLFEGYFSTKHPYSNFEFTMDIVDLIREPVYNEDGTVSSPVSNWIGISFGAPGYNADFNTSVRNSLFFLFEPNPGDNKGALKPAKSVRMLLRENFSLIGPTDRYLPDQYNFWNKDSVVKNGKTRSANIKFRMVDGDFSVYVKYEDEAWGEDKLVFSHEIGYTPFGTVRVMTYGSSRADTERLDYTPEQIYAGNVWLDNISIENLDYLAENFKTDIGYVPNIVDYGDGFQYTDSWDSADLLTGADPSGGCGKSASAGGIAVSAAALVGACALILSRTRG